MLVKEARINRNRFQNFISTKCTKDDSACSSAKLMWEGKIQAAFKMLSKDCKNCVLKIGDDILTELKSKHPPAAEIKQDSLLFGCVNELFCKISLLFS